MSFVYNNEVIDLLLKKSLGSAYTSSALVPGQENQILPKILNQQLLASPITNKTSSSFTWSSSSNVVGGGTVKSLSNVAGETEPASFTYIKKYENIPMTAVAGTNFRAWKPSNADMISKLENTIIGKSSFPFTLTTNITNYATIYNTNSSFKPVISNGVLLFLGNISPGSTSSISFTEVYIYEGEFGAKSELELNELTNVNVPTPSNGELLQWDAANSKWIAGAAASSAIANANIEALNNVNVSHATTNQDDSLIYDKANSQWVAGTPVTTLAGLSDTTITTPSDKQSLVYNATSSKWENANLTTDNITDINLTSVADGQALVYDSGTSKFINGLPTMNLNDINNVIIATPGAKNALIYDTNTQKWKNGLPILDIDDIADVNVSGATEGQSLIYDTTTSKWKPGSGVATSVTGVYLSDIQDIDNSNLESVVPVWTQSHKLAATTGQNGEYLGKSVSTIGTWTAVGAANNQDTGNLLSNVGRVFLFKAGTETQIISSPQNKEGSFFGQSVFLTSTFLAVGSTGYDDLTNSVINTGAVLIYNYNSGTELYATTPDQTLLGTANSYLGYSIDTNGTWMISGAPENISGTNNALKGKAYIYKLDGTWSQKKILTADDGTNGDKFGTAVAINNDYAFVGCETKTSYTGGVYIYKRTSDTVWDALHIVRTKTLAAGDYFGQSISVGGDFLMVGCPKGEYGGTADSTKAGEVFVYKKQSDGNWGDLSGNLGTTISQLGSDIDGEFTEDQFGYSVSMNQDGTIVAIGASEHNNSSGHVRVYQYSNNAWTQLGSDIDGEADDDNSGASISLSSDGTILAIGAPFNGGTGSNAGHVRVYQYANNAWTQLGSDIDAEAAGDEYGASISLSSDGSIVAIGSTVNDGNKGHVRVYQYSNNAWTQLGSDIDGETGGGEGIGDHSGIVSLSSDGSILAIGAPMHDGGKGHVRVYQYSNNAWTQLGSNIDGEAAGDNSGYSISLNNDGTILAIGAPYNNGTGNSAGHVRVYQYSNNSWTQLGSDIDGEAAGDRNGTSISLSSDGTILAIGASGNNGGGTGAYAGHVRVYQYSNNSWTQLGSDIDGEAAGDASGKSISLSSDGTTVAIGASEHDSERGHVRVYQLPIEDPTAGYYENSILTATDTAVNDHFGCSVDITTQFGVIGARTQGSSSYLKAGAAYMISNTGEGYWDHTKKITASDLAIGDEFGISVSIYDRYASIGAWKEEDASETDQGSAYVFNLASQSTVQNTLIYNSDTGRWSIGTITVPASLTLHSNISSVQDGNVLTYDAASNSWTFGTGSSNLSTQIGPAAMIAANTANGSTIYWDATAQSWDTQTSSFLPTGSPDQASANAGPDWTSSWTSGDNQVVFDSHLIPTTDDTYDIGSPAYKIRDLYISDNSLWIGDAHKITIEGGSMKFRKRDVSIVPASITAAGGNSTGALASSGVANLSAMKLHHWEKYAKTLNMAGGVGNARISDVFAANNADYADSDNISDKANNANPTFTGTVTLGQAPTGDLHAATKKYVDDTTNGLNTSTLAPKASPTFTGVVTLPTITNSSAATSAATKQYVDDTAGNIDTSTLAPKASPTFTGVVTLPTITNSSAATSAATKQYVDDTAGNIDTSTLAPKASPTFTGTPLAPTAAVGTNDSQLATTQFVTTATSNLAPKASPVFTGASARIESTTNNSQLQLKATHSSETQQYNIFSAVSGNSSGRGLHFQNHDTGSVQMSIRSDGKVGIGMMSPAGKLSIAHSGGSAATPDSNKDFCIYDNNNCGLYSKSGTSENGTTISYGLSYWNGSSAVDVDNALVLRNYSGENRVGIGTTSPTKLLTLRHPSTTASTYNGFKLETNGGNKRIIAELSGASGTGDAYICIYDNDGSTTKVQLHNNGNSYFNGGNVGIGTNSPSQKLDVNGTVKATAFQGDGSALTGVAKQADIDTAINGLIDSAPGTLDTLNEIAASIGDNGNFVGTVSNFGDVDTVTTAPTNGQALVWNSTNLKWEPGNVAASGGGSGPTNVMGQSFFEILTQQPHQFQADGAYTSSTSHITINWKYDSISLFHDSTVVAKLCFGANAQAKSLPFISQIKIQIKSPDTNNAWIDYTTLTVSSNQDYNTTASLKTITLPKFTEPPLPGIQTTLSKAGESNKFDVRVYGVNNSENYPTIDIRALLFSQVFYLVPNPPSTPIWSSEVAIGSDNSISFYYKCAETENIDPNNASDQSDAFITSAITKYVEIATLAYNNAVVGTEYTDTEAVSNKNENETFQIILNSLRAGTKYKYKVQAKNNLANNYSDISAFRDHSAYTRTPGDAGIATTVNFGINNSSKTNIRGYVDGSNTVSGSQIYINTYASKNVTPSSTSTQTIQITDPYSTTQHTTTTGYGNYVNGSTGLVTLKVTVDGNLKQTVSYGGFNTTPTNSGGDTGFIDTINQSDIYGTTNATKGFRLKGTFALNELLNTGITSSIGAARKTAHTLKYEYDRHADVGGSDASTTHNIYIDTLSGNPGITYTTSLVTVTSVKYTMGIASVDDMTITIVRTYTNCNSAHGFIIGTGNVGTIGSVSKTTYGSAYLYIAANNIDVSIPGSYTHTKSNTGINYTQPFTNGTNNSLSEISYAYNLNGNTTGTPQSLKRGSAQEEGLLNHFHDHNSYANDTTTTSKLTLSNLYQITEATISYFGSNMGAIATQAYTSHSTVPYAWTLLYINDGFRTNANFTYPNTSSMNYDSVSVNTYTTGTTAYSTAGASDANGYKWYCQKFSMSADKSSHNVSGAVTEYLNVYGIGGLSATTMNKVKNAADLDAIGFVQQNVSGSPRIGNLGRALKSTKIWYEQDGAVSWATQDTSAAKADYGSVYEESSTKWGPILDTTNGINDIYIFIGLKNTVSLS